jgi:hypothetical protein
LRLPVISISRRLADTSSKILSGVIVSIDSGLNFQTARASVRPAMHKQFSMKSAGGRRGPALQIKVATQ